MTSSKTQSGLSTEARNALVEAQKAISALVKTIARNAGTPAEEIRRGIGIGVRGRVGTWGSPAKWANANDTAEFIIRQLEKWRDSPPAAIANWVSANRFVIDAAIDRVGVFKVVNDGDYQPNRSRLSFAPFLPVEVALESIDERTGGNLLPLPSLADYRSDAVPDIFEGRIKSKLFEARIAYLYDVASAGKSTAAFVTAIAMSKDGHECFYIDLALPQTDLSVAEAFGRLLLHGRKQFIIVDNAHWAPELLSVLLAKHAGVDSRHRAKLLVVGTRGAGVATTTTLGDIDWPDDAFNITIGGAHLRNLATFYVRKFASRQIAPPAAAVKMWKMEFGNHLHSYAFALLGNCKTLGLDGNWTLDKDDAYQWILDNWLKEGRPPSLLSEQTLENLKCLSVFGAQDIESEVPKEALPYPRPLHMQRPKDLGIVKEVGRKGDARRARYHLTEPGWGELILGALAIDDASRQEILFSAAARSGALATTLDSRFTRYRSHDRIHELRRRLADTSAFPASVVRSSLTEIVYWERKPEFESSIQQALAAWLSEDKALLERSTIGGLIALYRFTTAWPDKLVSQEALSAIVERLEKDASLLEAEKIQSIVLLMKGVDALMQSTDVDETIVSINATLRSYIDNGKYDIADEKVAALVSIIKGMPDEPKLQTSALHELRRRLSDCREDIQVEGAQMLTTIREICREINDGDSVAWLDDVIESRVSELSHVTGADSAETETHHNDIVSGVFKSLIYFKGERKQERVFDCIDLLTKILKRALFYYTTVPLQIIVEAAQIGQDREREDLLLSIMSWLDRGDDQELEALLDGPPTILIEKLVVFSNCNKSLRGRLISCFGRVLDRALRSLIYKSTIEISELFSFIEKHDPHRLPELRSWLDGHRPNLQANIGKESLNNIAQAFTSRSQILNSFICSVLDEHEWGHRIPIKEQSLSGVAILIQRLMEGGARDFARLLAGEMASRANPADYVSDYFTLWQIGLVAAHCPREMAHDFILALKSTIVHCHLTDRFESLANGLLAFSYTEIDDLGVALQGATLTGRIRQHLLGNDWTRDHSQSNEGDFVKLLGAYSTIFDIDTIGGYVERYLERVPFAQLLGNPDAVHRPDVTYVERRQYQYWLGLRVLWRRTDRNAVMDNATVEQTLALWKENLIHSINVQQCRVAEARNRNMIVWLEACLRMQP